MRSRREIEELAARLGARADITERIVRLLGILERLATHELTRERWVLKGGTALNVFHFDLPRLSVDLDLNFLGAATADDLQRERPEFERALEACCALEECRVRRAPSEWAGGKFFLRFESVVGSGGQLELDVNYVARVPLLGVERRAPRWTELGGATEIPTLRLEELAAGKCHALMTRSASRDSFDACMLLESRPELFSAPEFRLAFTVVAAASRTDFRALPATPPVLDAREIANKLLPVLRVVGGTTRPSAEELERRFSDVLQPQIARLLDWSPGESRFLDRLLDDGELEPDRLTDDAELQDRVRRQPMLQWKRQHVRKRLGLDQGP